MRVKPSIALALAFVASTLLPAWALAPGFKAASSDEVLLDIPARYMWGWDEGHGYCGETSFQSSLLFYGNYVSQERIRYADGNKELLIGVHDEKAAKNLLLTYEAFDFEEEDNPHATSFLDFTMRHLDRGNPVVAGWFLKKRDGDDDYDHIMPIIGYKGSNNGSKRKAPTAAALTFNDLYSRDSVVVKGGNTFQTRSQCTMKSPAQPYSYCLPVEVNYGIALTGNVDPEAMLYRTILRAESWSEPDWGAEDGLDEKPEQQRFAATVYGLTVGEEYVLLRFDSVADLEDSRNFLDLEYADRIDFTATGPEYTVDGISLRSDGEHYFRAVSLKGIPPPNQEGGPHRRHRRRHRILGMSRTVFAIVCAAVGAFVLLSVAALLCVCRSHGFCCFTKRGAPEAVALGDVVAASPAPAYGSSYSADAADAVGTPAYVPSGPYSQVL
jgi:hypothetical protein